MTAAKIEDPTGNTGTEAGVTVKENQRDSTTGTLRYLLADKVVTLVEETGTTAEAVVREGDMVQTKNPPTKTGRKFGAAVRTFGKEAGRRRKNDGLGDGEKIFVRPCHQGAHNEASN